jgi:hypothetical protein
MADSADQARGSYYNYVAGEEAERAETKDFDD